VFTTLPHAAIPVDGRVVFKMAAGEVNMTCLSREGYGNEMMLVNWTNVTAVRLRFPLVA
jgi:hypothetical protein